MRDYASGRRGLLHSLSGGSIPSSRTNFGSVAESGLLYLFAKETGVTAPLVRIQPLPPIYEEEKSYEERVSKTWVFHVHGILCYG